MYNSFQNLNLSVILSKNPNAISAICGSSDYPKICGFVRFYQTNCGIVIFSEIKNLPIDYSICHNAFFGFHIHQGQKCSGNSSDEFADVLSHYNSQNCNHPSHAGDLPPLIAASNGYAISAFMTDKFNLCEIIGKTIIIHAHSDDFTTDPSGNAGAKIACGEIKQCC